MFVRLLFLLLVAGALTETLPPQNHDESPPSSNPFTFPEAMLPKTTSFPVPKPSTRTSGTRPKSPSSSSSTKTSSKRQEEDRGPRPQLTNSRVLPLKATVTNEKFEYLLSTLEFDQDLYANQAFVCPGQERDCVVSTCEPCDWTMESPTDCTNPSCCGAAEYPWFVASNHTSDWCDPSLPSYTKLEFGVRSEVFQLKAGEKKYFRFFVGEEESCRSILVQPNIHFGNPDVTVSNFVAYPDREQLNQFENGQFFLASTFSPKISQYGYEIIQLCPNVNPSVGMGTYAIAVTGSAEAENTEMAITVHLGEEQYPILPSEDRASCADLPASELTNDHTFLDDDFLPVTEYVCLEEGETVEIFLDEFSWKDLVFPVQPGCHEISVSLNQNHEVSGLNPVVYLFMGRSFAFPVLNNVPSALKISTGNIYVSACFEEVTYLHTSVFSFFSAPPLFPPVSVLWTTKSTPIRERMVDLNSGELTTSMGMSLGGSLHPYLNFESEFSWGLQGYSWNTQPSLKPLVFNPPYPEVSYNFSEPPINAYEEAGFLQPKSNIVSTVHATTRRNNVIRDQQQLLEGGFVYFTGLTSETGMPVELCNDADLERGECQRGTLGIVSDWSDFMPTRTFSTLNVQKAPDCEVGDYDRELRLVQQVTGGDSATISEIAKKAYLRDLYNAALPRTACVLFVEGVLETEDDNITKLVSDYCTFEPFTIEWEEDPCCNPKLTPVQCCAPEFVDLEEALYTEADESDLEKLCYHSDCDESFFTDLASSLNVIGNPLIGCATGFEDPLFQLDVLTEKVLASFLRPCLVESGFGELFDGIACGLDEECEYLGTTCDQSTGKCVPQSTEVMRDRYFDCFFDNMPPKVEDYIRYHVLSTIDSELPSSSKAFKQAVRIAATHMDCVGREGTGARAGLSVGERWTTDSTPFCKMQGLGLLGGGGGGGGGIDVGAYLRSICPEFLCLGKKGCQFVKAKMCGITEECKDPLRAYHPPMESSCPTTTTCSANHQQPHPDDETCEGYSCVVCPSESAPCVVVDGVTTEEECANVVACEVPGGEFRFDLTAEECEELVGECSTDCPGESCRSLAGYEGVCGIVGMGEDQCNAISGVWGGVECWLVYVGNEGECTQMGAPFMLLTNWYTCGSLDVSSCSNHSTFSFPHLYLQCYVDTEFRECETREECINSGKCSDLEITRQVLPTDGWFDVVYGICLTSGVGGWGGNIYKIPDCWQDVGEFDFPYGCVRRTTSPMECAFWGSSDSILRPHWTVWLTPAKSEEECSSRAMGRYGCYLPHPYQKSYYFWNDTACDCRQGTSDYFFSWSSGTWEGGIPHTTIWQEKEKSLDYTWEETISFVRMEDWVTKAVETTFAYALKSELICENNYVTSSLSTLVCDCVGDGDSCFPSNIETEVGVTEACADDTSILKGPSSFTTFSEDSIEELCTEATLYLIQRSWFLFPRELASVSFQFSERPEKGVVLNKRGATVGEVMGDGSKILFRSPERVNRVTVCLIIVEDIKTIEKQYPQRDFGMPLDDYSSILPLGLSDVEQREIELYTYWCAEFEGDSIQEDGSMTFFPVARLEDYEDEEEEYLSHQTESLLITLGVCYIVDLIVLSLFVFVTLKNTLGTKKPIPPVFWLGVLFAVVCVFRIVFCFVYLEDGFSELSEYVIFEIPTFVLFSALILVTCLFLRLSEKKGFDFKSQDKTLWAMGGLALLCVWSLFMIVTIYYAEVILDQTDESECPGRVKGSNEEVEEDTRTLSIIYQSIVIFFTFLLAIVFARQAFVLFRMTKNSSKANTFVFRVGSILVVGFFLRCILFLVLLSIDLTSDIYLFVTLMLTEVIMMLLIGLEVNKNFYYSIASTVGSLTWNSGTGSDTKTGSNSSNNTK